MTDTDRPLGAWGDSRTRILLALCTGTRPTYRDLAKAAGLRSVSTAYAAVQGLIASGLVVSDSRLGATRAAILRPTVRITAIYPTPVTDRTPHHG